jgi:hypothetical protein
MPKVNAKKKCCKDSSRCSKCPLVLMRLVKLGYAERGGKSDYKVSAKVPKKVLVVARAR